MYKSTQTCSHLSSSAFLSPAPSRMTVSSLETVICKHYEPKSVVHVNPMQYQDTNDELNENIFQYHTRYLVQGKSTSSTRTSKKISREKVLKFYNGFKCFTNKAKFLLFYRYQAYPNPLFQASSQALQ